MHDVNGEVLKVGDEVCIRCIVTGIFASEEYCNASLETVFPMHPTGQANQISCINTRQLEKSHNVLPNRIYFFFKHYPGCDCRMAGSTAPFPDKCPEHDSPQSPASPLYDPGQCNTTGG
jgi:hypothetical protein